MNTADAKKAQLVEAVVEHQVIKAAAIVDERGRFRRMEGNANVFRNGDPIGPGGARQQGDGNHEDVFIESVGEDYLIVVFKARQDFEPIKEEVDRLLEALDL